MGSQVGIGVKVLSAPWNVGICILDQFNTDENYVRNGIEGAPITASPSKVGDASKVGGTLASPISWV